MPGWSSIVMLSTGALHVVVGGPNLPVRSGPQGMPASTRGSTVWTLLGFEGELVEDGGLVIQRLRPWSLGPLVGSTK